MRVCILGVTGYIGNSIAQQFVSAGATVFAPTRATESAERIHNLLSNEITPIPYTTFTELSANDAIKSCEVIIDAVGSKLVAPEFFAAMMVYLTLNPAVRYILTSGLLVYGNQPGVVISEEIGTANAHEYVKWRPGHESKVLEAGGTVLRPGWVYGRSQGKYMWFNYINQTDKKVTMYGSETKRTSWIHADDLGAAFVAVAKAPLENVKGKAFSVADDTQFPSHREVFEAIAKEAGAVVVPTPVPADNMWENVVECEQMISAAAIKKATGWAPKAEHLVPSMGKHYRAWEAARALKTK